LVTGVSALAVSLVLTMRMFREKCKDKDGQGRIQKFFEVGVLKNFSMDGKI